MKTLVIVIVSLAIWGCGSKSTDKDIYTTVRVDESELEQNGCSFKKIKKQKYDSWDLQCRTVQTQNALDKRRTALKSYIRNAKKALAKKSINPTHSSEIIVKKTEVSLQLAFLPLKYTNKRHQSRSVEIIDLSETERDVARTLLEANYSLLTQALGCKDLTIEFLCENLSDREHAENTKKYLEEYNRNLQILIDLHEFTPTKVSSKQQLIINNNKLIEFINTKYLNQE